MKKVDIINKENCSVILIEDAITLSPKVFATLSKTINWRHDSIKIFGKIVSIPRLHAWYADHSKYTYKYSTIQMTANMWTKELFQIKNETENITGLEFNSALINFYRTGNEYAAWHSDDEKELGPSPSIASVSLGETRLFHLRHKVTGETTKIELTHGSILLMSGETQHVYKHQLAKTSKNIEPRINITFRNIVEYKNKENR
jgi:alkylated DNA repair dioxygenase AlkB